MMKIVVVYHTASSLHITGCSVMNKRLYFEIFKCSMLKAKDKYIVTKYAQWGKSSK